MDEKSNVNNKTHDALVYIADGIQRLELSEKVSVATPKTSSKNKIRCHNMTFKSKLKFKIQHIAKLRNDLKAACWVAKTMMSVKKRETTALTCQVEYARGECLDLLKRYNNNIGTIEILHKQNVSLHEELESLAKFIHLGYEDLKKIQGGRSTKLTTLAQLRQLIESCCRYYSDYSNEIKMSQKIKQRNWFLKSKIIILENNIGAIKEQLKALEYRYLRMKAENNQIKAKNVESLNFKFSYSGVQIKKNIDDHERSTEKHCQDSGDSLAEQTQDFDLTTHLDIVKRLLLDQDTLLKDLTMISRYACNV